MGKIRAWGLCLLAVGVYLLGGRQGWWGTITWWELLAWLRVYWPIVLIALGLLILLRPYRHQPGVDVLYGLLDVVWGVGVVLVIVAFVTGFGGWWVWDREPGVIPGPGGAVELVEPLDGAARAGVKQRELRVPWPEGDGRSGVLPQGAIPTATDASLQLIAGGLELEVGAGAAGSPNLLGGTVEWRREAVQARSAAEATASRRTVRIAVLQGTKDRYFGPGWFKPGEEFSLPLRWQLRLAPEASWQLDARVGGARARFDLRNVPVAGVTVRGGAGDFQLWLPGPGVWRGQPPPSTPVDVDLAAGAAAVRVYAPRGVGVEFEVHSPLSGHNLADQELGLERIGGGIYRSDGYDQTSVRYRIRVSMGAAGLTFRWLPAQQQA